MKKLFVAVASAGIVFSALAHADVIEDRQAAMKNNGKNAGELAKMAKGEVAYDPAAAVAAFQSMREGTEGLAELFPEGSETGGETEASPRIWEDMDGFKAQLAEFHADLDAAIAAQPATLEEFGPVFGEVAQNCQACHEKYRIMKQ